MTLKLSTGINKDKSKLIQKVLKENNFKGKAQYL